MRTLRYLATRIQNGRHLITSQLLFKSSKFVLSHFYYFFARLILCTTCCGSATPFRIFRRRFFRVAKVLLSVRAQKGKLSRSARPNEPLKFIVVALRVERFDFWFWGAFELPVRFNKKKKKQSKTDPRARLSKRRTAMSNTH